MPDSEIEQGNNRSSEFFPWILLLPFVLLLLVIFVSPNFRWGNGQDRSAPYGGDFLQEWVGGSIIRSDQRLRLYDLTHVKSVQHDRSRIGFEWSRQDYFPMVYPPHYYLLVSPLSSLSYRWSTLLWATLSTFVFSLTGFLLYRYYPPCRRRFSIWFVAACLFVPWLKCLTMGQKSSLLLLLLTVTFLLQYHRRSFWAGVAFGVIAIKPQLGLAIGIAMLWKRQSEFVLGAVLTASTLIGLSWMYEPELWLEYLEVVTGMGDYLKTGGYQLAESHSLWGGVEMLFGSRDGLFKKMIAAALGMIVLGCLAVALKGELQPDLDRYALQFSALVASTVLLSPHFYTYDLTILLLPMILIPAVVGIRPANRADQIALAVLLMIYLLGGLFSRIANVIGWQPSLLLIGGLIVSLMVGCRNREMR